MAEHSYRSNLAKLGRALIPVALSLRSGALSTNADIVVSSNTSVRLDWTEWDNMSDAQWLGLVGPNDVLIDASTNGSENGKGRRKEGKTLRQFVGDCARLLQLPGLACDDLMHHDGYKIPFMDAANSSSCRFQTRMEYGTLEHLASRYAFYFVGDSTTRRLAESFVSIFTCQPSTHPMAHERVDMSSGGLKVIFQWAPHCEDVGPAIRASINETVADQLRNGGARGVIITAFGVHDAYTLFGREEPRTPPPHTERAEQAALAECEKVTSQLVHVANPTTGGLENEETFYRPGHRGLGVADDREAKSSGRRGTWTGNDGASSSDDKGLPPLVFLLQNNRYLPGSDKDRFLEEVHDIQDRVVREAADATAGGGEDAGVFVLNDRESLYKPMSCYRIGDSIHVWEPVKLVEGYMLWHLLALVDAWSC